MLLGMVPYAFGHATICILGTLPYTFKDSTMFYMIQQIILKVLITLLMLVLSKAASISSKTKNGAGWQLKTINITFHQTTLKNSEN